MCTGDYLTRNLCFVQAKAIGICRISIRNIACVNRIAFEKLMVESTLLFYTHSTCLLKHFKLISIFVASTFIIKCKNSTLEGPYF